MKLTKSELLHENMISSHEKITFYLTCEKITVAIKGYFKINRVFPSIKTISKVKRFGISLVCIQ